jgi:hypothetical protein
MKKAFHGEVYDTANAILLERHEPPAGIEALKGQRVVNLSNTGRLILHEEDRIVLFLRM